MDSILLLNWTVKVIVQLELPVLVALIGIGVPYAKCLLYIWAAQIAYPHARKKKQGFLYMGNLVYPLCNMSPIYVCGKQNNFV